MSTTFFVHPGDLLDDLPFNTTLTRSQTFEASITFTGTGVQVTLENLRTAPNFEKQTMTAGTSPVVPNRPHAGLFNITITSIIGGAAQGPPNSILSLPYAYVASSLVPSRYLYGSDVITTSTNGNFTASINRNTLLGAKNLTVFLLARGATGIVLVNNPSSIGFTDSTTLSSTAESIGPVGRGQSVTATLSLKSNSASITEAITVILTVQGNGLNATTEAEKGVTISPGASVTVSFTFTAPSNVGSYTLTFSSPEYGGVLASETLQVTILQSNLQFLIPAGIGVVAAIIVLGFYMIQGRRAEEEKEAPKPKGPGPKPKPSPSDSAPTKSLTQAGDSSK